MTAYVNKVYSFNIFFKKLLTKDYFNDILVKYFALQHILMLERRRLSFMFEKNLELGYLLDFYGELLSERKRTVMDMNYNEDLSLAEIAAEIGISRQGARDIIKKSEEELLFFEEKLGLAKKLQGVSNKASELKEIANKLSLDESFKKKLDELISAVEG